MPKTPKFLTEFEPDLTPYVVYGFKNAANYAHNVTISRSLIDNGRPLTVW